MKTTLALILCCSVQLAIAQPSTNDVESLFDRGRIALADNQLEDASRIFKQLYQRDSSNANLAFLYGQTLVNQDTLISRAIHYLRKAAKGYSPDYHRGNYHEKRSSEYVYYYLLKAYSLHGDCDQTLKTLNHFYSIYSYENEWYLIDGQRLHLSCVQREKPEDLPPAQPIATTHKQKAVIGTKSVNYTDKTSQYGVQISATIDPVFTYKFQGLKNVEVYVDDNGIYRYIVGRFLYKGQAERLLESIVEAGYPDAFIVNVKDKTRYTEEVITINQESIHKALIGTVDYRVQIGAFRGDTIPENLMDIYLQLDSISEVQQGDLTILTVGSFNNYDAAQFFKEIVQDIGVSDAFITAWNYNRKVPMEQAKIYLREQKALHEEFD